MLNRVFARLTVAILSLVGPPGPDAEPHHRLRGSRGQATTEYALVLLAAALVALLVVAWATAGGGAAKVARLFNKVIDSVIDKV
jgi:hypothetical protein